MQAEARGRRIEADRREFLAYRTTCPFSGDAIGPRFVTREHSGVPPDPPYAASVRCPGCKQEFEVIFSGGS